MQNHHKWADAAKFLGCHSIRVNAATGNAGSFEEQQKRAADGLAKAARMQREAVDKAATRLEELRRAVSSARTELNGLVSTLRSQKMELALGKRELQTLKRTLREKVAQK